MEIKELFNENSIDKQLTIRTDDGLVTITNTELHSQQFELSETLCSEQDIQFGACEASVVKFKISNIFIPLTGKWITITVALEGKEDEPYQIGRYKVSSDVPTADKRYRDVTAYDSMHDIINADMGEWYESILPNSGSRMTMKQFRTSFMNRLGITQEEVKLANDDMTVTKTIEISDGVNTETEGEQNGAVKESALSGKDVITAICEINGCFGHIGQDGKFHYVYLPQDIQGLYPANDLYPNKQPAYLPPTHDGKLYPRDAKGTRIGGGSYINCTYEDYTVRSIDKVQIFQEENNVIAEYGDGNSNIYGISGNFLVYGKGMAEAEEIASNIYEKIREIIYIPLNCEAVGNPCILLGEPVRLNTKYKIIESYVLQRTLSGIQSMRDTYVSTGLETRAKKLNSVRQEIKNLKGKTNTLTRTAEETRSELKDLENDTESRFVQTAEKIETEVANRQNADEEMSSRIEQNAESISLKVSKGDVSSQLSLESGKVTISSNRLVVESTNFRLNEQGQVFIKDTLRFESGDNEQDVIYREGHTNRPVIDVYSGFFSGDVTVEGTIFGNAESADRAENAGYADFSGYADVAKQAASVSEGGIPSSFINDFDLVTESGKASNFYSGMSHQGRKLIGTKRPVDTSDERLKKDIKPLEDMETVYMGLEPISFKFHDGLKGYDRQIQYGFSAQKTKEVLENSGFYENALIWESEADEELYENLFTGFEKVYKLDKDQMHAMHVQMIQKLMKKNRKLENMVNELNARLERLESGMIGGE